MPRLPLEQGGNLKYSHTGEYHAYNPDIIKTLQQAVHSGEYSDYLKYSALVSHRPITTLRDLLSLKIGNNAIDIDDVEPASSLYQRFDTAAMSIGALSPEAHEALAIAMNTLGGFSNSGEGGEDPVRYGTLKRSESNKLPQAALGSRRPI